MSRAAKAGRHAQPKRRAEGSASLFPALTPLASRPTRSARADGPARPGRRRADGPAKVAGSHRAPRHASGSSSASLSTHTSPDSATAERPAPWARTVAFSGVTGVAALTVGLSVLTDPESASGFDLDPSPQRTAAVTVIEAAAAPQPAARRTAPAEYAAPDTGTAAAPAPAAPETTPPAPVTVPAPAAPTSRPAPAPGSSPAPAPEETDAPAPAPEESPTPGLLDGLTGTLEGTLDGVVSVLPDLGG